MWGTRSISDPLSRPAHARSDSCGSRTTEGQTTMKGLPRLFFGAGELDTAHGCHIGLSLSLRTETMQQGPTYADVFPSSRKATIGVE